MFPFKIDRSNLVKTDMSLNNNDNISISGGNSNNITPIKDYHFVQSKYGLSSSNQSNIYVTRDIDMSSHLLNELPNNKRTLFIQEPPTLASSCSNGGRSLIRSDPKYVVSAKDVSYNAVYLNENKNIVNHIQRLAVIDEELYFLLLSPRDR